MPNQQNITLRARGIYTFPNTLGEVPDGALSEANNVVIDRDGVINPRRGFKLYGDSFGTGSDRAKQLLLYKGRILRHWTTKLDVDSTGTGTFTTMKNTAGADAVVNGVESGVRIKYVEANGNLFFTTSKGIYKISCLNVADITTRPVTSAGGVKALDGYATLNSETGWFTEDSIVAYRIVWGIKDDNTNVILGTPSERIIISNSLLSLLIQDYNNLVADLATCAAVPSFTKVGDTHSNTTIDNLPNVTNLSVGMTITGTGIPASTLISSIDTSTSITISNAATATAAGVTFTFDERLKDTDYSSLKISLNSTAVVLYAALKALAYGGSNKLDNDVGGTTFQTITLTPTSTPDVPTPTGELVDMQTYFDEIVNALNVTTGVSTYAKTFIGGAFTNSTQSATTNVTFTVPPSITTAHFYQVYRSALFTSTGASLLTDLQPDDELNLIFEDNPTTTQISPDKSITFFDNIPESFRVGGANLYTNANSGEGIAQANEPPPLALDIASFKNSTFYANTSTLYKVEIGLLTATGLAGGKIYIAQGSTINSYTFVASVAQITSITAIAGASYTAAGTSDYFDIYSANSTNHYRLWFQSGTSVAPSAGGATLIQITIDGTETATQAATKIAQALTGLSDFSATSSSAVVTATNEDTGYATSPSETVANAGFTITVSTSGTGEQASSQKVGISNADTPAQEVDETARSLVRVINKNASEVVNAFYVSGVNDLPGLILLEARQLGDPAFYVVASSNTISAKFNPDLKQVVDITNISAANPTVITSMAHGLITGDQIIIVGSNSTPSVDGIKTITKIDANTFTVDVNATVMGTVGKWIKTSNAIKGDNEVVPNRLYYSKYQQPEAVPLVNYQDVGPKNKRILRIIPLRESLFILTEAGVYRLAGDTTANFQITLFDSSTQIKAVDSAVVLNNQIYMFSSQGIATISDTGISIISRPIENKLLPLVASRFTNFPTATFAVSYESDRAYLLFTIIETTDTVATIVYRYNTFTNAWVSWDISKTCGVINADQDKLYLGAGDINFIENERKDFTRLDHADRQSTITFPIGGVNGNVIALGGFFGAEPGDAFVQTQYLTIAQLNRLLRYIDTDRGGVDKDYYSTLGVVGGENLRTTLTNLANKLDNDTGFAYTGFAADISGFSDSFIDTQDAFNVVVGDLIADANSFHKDYAESNNTVEYEIVVSAVDNINSLITLTYSPPLIAGPIVLYKKIASFVVWIPHHFGDASMVKQVSESTILFENVAFSAATASYSSDLSTGFQDIPVRGEGTGIWGGFDWGQVVFGGEGSSRPFRTLIPRNKQRCRYINGKFEHSIAFENYSIFGISYTFSPISNRGYR